MAAKHVIFIVHGMGKPDEESFKSVTLQLGKLHNKYSKTGDTFSKRFKCVQINYDKLFEKQRAGWASNLKKITGGTTPLPFKATKDLVDSLQKDSFFTTHIMDVLMYRYIPTIAEQIRSEVRLQILDERKNGGNPAGTKYSIISRSLGTSVIFDALSQWGELKSNGKYEYPFWKNTHLRFEVLAQISNVSDVLETDWDPYNSCFRPGATLSPTKKFIANKMLSASHKYDPIAQVDEFEPDPTPPWPDQATVDVGNFHLAQPKIIQSVNTHSISHYLNDPSVHIPLIRMLRYSRIISKDRELKELEKFRKNSPSGKLKEIRKRLQVTNVGSCKDNLQKYIGVVKDFKSIIDDLT